MNSIDKMIRKTLENNKIDFSNCCDQDYNNAANMSGRLKNTQAILIEENDLARYSPCTCHSLNMCRQHAANVVLKALHFW